MRAAVAGVLGAERAERFFDALLDAFFGPEDAALLAELGVNCVRLPVNYRQFAREEGFTRLDRAIRACAEHGIYTVIDLHAVPGCQNQHWHSDNPTHLAAFWEHAHFQELVVELWQVLAERHRDDPWVAGYNLLNEPGDPSGRVVGPFYDRLVAAIREIDANHIVFVDGNTYSTDFSIFAEPYENAIYACHDYARAGMAFGGPYPGDTQGVWVDRDAVEEKFLERTRWQRETGTPLWVGRSSAPSTPATPSATSSATSCSPTSSRSTRATAPAGRSGPTRTSASRASSTRRPTAPTCSASPT